MLTDRENTVSIDQAITVTAVSTDMVYVAGRGLGRGYPERFYAQMATAATSGGATTIAADLIASDDAAGTVNVTVLVPGVVTPKATAVAGYRLAEGTVPYTAQAYIGFRYNVATGPFTSLTNVDAGFVPNTSTPIAQRPIGFTGL